MDRDLYLQDDTFFQEQRRSFNSDQSGLPYWFLDKAILALLERDLALDLTAFRRIADDTELWIDDEGMADDDLRAQLTALRQQLDTAWQTRAIVSQPRISKIPFPLTESHAVQSNVQTIPATLIDQRLLLGDTRGWACQQCDLCSRPRDYGRVETIAEARNAGVR